LQSANQNSVQQNKTIHYDLTNTQDIVINEENETIKKYINQIDLLTPEFISLLPQQDRNILNKILDQETRTFPKDIPFTMVQKNLNTNNKIQK
jgi:hypothetical protein